jgi:hypothetical protein
MMELTAWLAIAASLQLAVAALATQGAGVSGTIAKPDRVMSERIPPSFAGRWETELSLCAQEPNEDTLFIEPGALQYYEQREVVTQVEIHAPRDITVWVTGSFGGDDWSEQHRIRVSDDLSEIRFEAAQAPSFRCPG